MPSLALKVWRILAGTVAALLVVAALLLGLVRLASNKNISAVVMQRFQR